MTGSGTLANEAMIARIKIGGQHGLILTNGEFGNRLISQAERQGLSFETYQKEWGQEYEIAEIEAKIENAPCISWMMFTHCESSTGCIADLNALTELGTKYGIKICVDAMSTIGNIPLNLKDVYMVTCSSGKGLGSFAGIGIVFTQEELLPDERIPKYLDLGYYFSCNGIPFTISSNLIMALNRAVDYSLKEDRTRQIEKLSELLLRKVGEINGLQVLNKKFRILSHIITIIPPPGIDAVQLGERVKILGVETSFNSGYLKERNQLQIAIMGQHHAEDILAFVSGLKVALKELGSAKIVKSTRKTFTS
jgi:aspartate aminotransferase-like enzyme